MCGGDGQRGCPRCDPEPTPVLAPARDETATHDTERLLEHVMAGVKALDDLRRQSLPAGYLACPGCSLGGSGLFGAGPGCKYCDRAGKLACPTCAKKGHVKCTACAGRGQDVRACEACNGAKLVPDPKLVPLDQRGMCPWCAGAGVRACTDCGVDGRFEGPCLACAGKGSAKCPTCLGSKSEPCKRCASTGIVTNVVTGASDCGICHRKGSVDCKTCQEKGTVTCGACQGTKTEHRACPACGSDHKRPCLGCFRESLQSWECTAEMLEKAGDPENSAGWLEGARDQLRRSHAAYLVRFEEAEAACRERLDSLRRGDSPARATSGGKPLTRGDVEEWIGKIRAEIDEARARFQTRDAGLVKRISELRAKLKPAR